MDAQLTVSTSAGTLATWLLESAWPTNVDVSEVPAGDAQVIDFTVTLRGSTLVLNP